MVESSLAMTPNTKLSSLIHFRAYVSPKEHQNLGLGDSGAPNTQKRLEILLRKVKEVVEAVNDEI